MNPPFTLEKDGVGTHQAKLGFSRAPNSSHSNEIPLSTTDVMYSRYTSSGYNDKHIRLEKKQNILLSSAPGIPTWLPTVISSGRYNACYCRADEIGNFHHSMAEHMDRLLY